MAANASTTNLKLIFTGNYTVTERPTPVPGDLRIAWGQSLLLLVLASSRSQKCSLQKLHFLAHLSRTSTSRDQTRNVLARVLEPSALSVRVEPWVNRAVAFAKASGLVTVAGGNSVGLTEDGKRAAEVLRKEGILAEEAEFLDQVGKITTEKVVEHILKMEDF